MNWRLIIQLSGFGLAIGIASIWWIPSTHEPVFWLAAFLMCAYLVAKKCDGRYFLHGFLISLANCVWVTSAHAIFFTDYAAYHPEAVAWTPLMPDHPRLMMLIVGPVSGVVSGLVLGLFCWIASKIVKR